MGMQMQGSGGGGTRRRRRASSAHQPVSEINVTPFVDVMLVLLIIFMVTATVIVSGVPLELPESRGQSLNAETQPITVTVTETGAVFIGDTPVSIGELQSTLAANAETGTDKPIFVRGDRSAMHQNMMQVLGTIQSAGFTKINLVSLPEGAGG
ncbi:MAG: biopolymer transporter ExbD [Pseudomonadota bacterium]